ncbi:signal recognition particle-docking protein FtsY [Mastigocoleus sp. MO_188.B34]|uniref:signal recognition particle-docking protein FtsY n=1 Tax=Mastigocoleus sp. MO_188.B34 TaxID=3036635 RepID=UPI00260D0C1A|nr:signal recognition particle-docking protein FtsY [Mastigocoleus sp. MO_188.B34]MDJ0695769.1 signal recognition particle-docking protein FtsY [Mastigocoleus sp. MO_188.B34]
MVFNWFRRQYNDSSKTTSDEKKEEKISAKEEDTSTSSSKTSPITETENSSDEAVDYLVWAKAAYKNIQEKQQTQELPSQETQEVRETSPETKTQTEESVAQEETSNSDIIASETTQELPVTTESKTKESATEEASDRNTVVLESTEESSSTTDTEKETSVIEVEQTRKTIVSESTQELSNTPVESTVLESTIAENSVTEQESNINESTASESNTTFHAAQEVKTDVEETSDQEKISVTANSSDRPQANLSFLERAAAERKAKQERLIANAIETSEPETEGVASQISTDAGSNIDSSAIPGVEFDEGFLWSAEILAAQGRRPEDISVEEITWLKKLRQGLGKTRRGILNQLRAIVGQGPLNQAGVEEIEALLLQADVGVEATDFIVNSLQEKLRQETLPPEKAIAYLKEILRDMLDTPLKNSDRSVFAPDKDSFNIWLVNGVNGAGKTTTIGKISHLAQKSGYKCLIGAADTFRAAAVEQVKVWGERSGVEVIANKGKNTDPAAVVFDAISAAQARGTELLLIDTAGRLQNKKNLMEELSKIRRIIDKKAADARVESLLVLDATLGQNGLRQAQVFSQSAKLSGVVLTKLDGTAKGGVALAVVKQLGLPIRFIGAGEGIEDLRPFSSYEFVEALLSS